MNILITGKDVKATEAIKDYIEKKMSKLEKYYDNEEINATAVIKVERELQIAELATTYKGQGVRAVAESKDLYVGQSSLTGESDAVRKDTETELENIDDIEFITDLDTICFMGTDVISGSAKAVVIKTADDTYFGKVSHTLTSGKPKTAFERGIENISKLLMKFMFVVIPITFILNAWKHDTLTAFTFAVSIAIIITPLLLPVILSSMPVVRKPSIRHWQTTMRQE